MEYDKDKVDDVILALLYLTSAEDEFGNVRAWKGHAFEHTDRLHEKGYIDDPKGQAKSVALTEEGRKRSQKLFRRYFADEPPASER